MSSSLLASLLSFLSLFFLSRPTSTPKEKKMRRALLSSLARGGCLATAASATWPAPSASSTALRRWGGAGFASAAGGR